MRKWSLLHFLIWISLPPVLPQFAWSQSAKVANQDSPCSPNSLPDGLQTKLAAQFASWRIQDVHDLSPSANARWASGYYEGCPGIATGEFRDKIRPSYGVLLVPRDRPNAAYRFVVYTPARGTSEEEFAVVEKRDVEGASNFFLNAAHLDAIFDEESRRKKHMSAKDAVLLFDAGETEYEVDAYYWSESAYRNSPVDL